MIEITKENDEIKIVISYKKLIKVYQVCFLFFLILIFILFDFEFPAMILNPLSAMFFIYLILISFFGISYEKITIKENYILLEVIRNNKRICYSQKISLDEINKTYFKSSFLRGRSRDLLTYIFPFDRYLKIETNKKTYSFGKEIDYEDYLKINKILIEKVREYKAKKIILDKERNREEELEAIYKLGVEERYIEILNAIIDEEKLFISKKEENFLIDAINKSKDSQETDFYVFYVNYLSKKEYANQKVLVGYNGIDGKEVTMSKLKEDINKLRDDRSTFK
ncbi:hypothetical protein [Fusobacterium pseudoperiodonticum]|uniref:Uncharacterized protein n=1 Tax=Fusobacterium pseudoperiodonticum TaxID=2663009 RepID=A0AAD0ANK8_9FUSO|nr:hypothetical protein [Fusobacterium pseudoperiodonticum]ATV36758.1 hypothetical protein CTM64_12850 [Fusobacterium pseudoperiodonticum]ATV62713.1 hypothetical protein CTM74_13280 [Fusobacterium pseudoperiodonticum]